MTPEIPEILIREYLTLLGIYEGFNDQALLIKGWSVTLVTAALIAAYARPVAENAGRAGVVLAALLTIPFWLTDALWKSFQLGYLPRLEGIEAQVAASSADGFAPLQAISGWHMAYDSAVGQRALDWVAQTVGFADLSNSLYLQALFNPSVLLPHAPLLVLGLIMAVFVSPNRKPADVKRRSMR